MGRGERRVEGFARKAHYAITANADIARKLGVASVLFIVGDLDAQFPRSDELCEQVERGKGDVSERALAGPSRLFRKVA